MRTTFETLCDGGECRDQRFADEHAPSLVVRRADIVDCDFTGCQMPEALFVDVDFERCRFDACDLQLARFVKCSFSDVKFEGSRLVGINWCTAGLAVDFSFAGCRLDGASFAEMNLKKYQFVECSLVDVSFAGADLRKAEFLRCQLDRAEFTHADLRGADLSTSTGVSFDPETVRLGPTAISLETGLELLKRDGLTMPAFDA